jgi:MoxR-like ATPase
LTDILPLVPDAESPVAQVVDPDVSGLAESADPEAFRATAHSIEHEVMKAIVGQREAVRGVLICLIADGHALLEGVPGLGKTSLARAFAAALGTSHNRVQFTPDLLPADITGTTVLSGSAALGLQARFEPGPVFTSILLADEINRASPRTQSALLEAMQEGTVTVAGETHPLPQPFCVLATQNPIEMHGTYPLPEAQLDRFFLKLGFAYPGIEELTSIIGNMAGDRVTELEAVADGPRLLAMNQLARQVPTATHVLDYIGRLLLALQPSSGAPPLVRDYVRVGPSPRGGIALSLAGRVTALLDGRHNLAVEDIQAVALPALRHRLVLNFDADRDGVTPEAVVTEALARVREVE